MKIINLTQHAASAEQAAAGVFEPKDKSFVQRLLTFDTLPTEYQIWCAATELAKIAAQEGAEAAMIGGAPYLMAPLERMLLWYGVEPLYAFSTRDSVEETQADGSIRKVNVFRHGGFIKAVAQE